MAQLHLKLPCLLPSWDRRSSIIPNCLLFLTSTDRDRYASAEPQIQRCSKPPTTKALSRTSRIIHLFDVYDTTLHSTPLPSPIFGKSIDLEYSPDISWSLQESPRISTDLKESPAISWDLYESILGGTLSIYAFKGRFESCEFSRWLSNRGRQGNGPGRKGDKYFTSG